MKRKRRISGIFTTLMMIIPLLVGLFGMGNSSIAAEGDPPSEETTIVINKKKMDDFPAAPIENTGSEMPELEGYDPMPGVVFDAYDITDHFYAEFNKTLSGDETRDEYSTKLEAFTRSFKPTALGASVGNATTDNDGKATFNLEKYHGHNGYKVYHFVETKNSGDTWESHSSPITVVLPIMGSDGKQLNPIQLYAKNKISEVKKDLLGEGTTPLPEHQNPDDYYDFELGKVITYRATSRVPDHIGDIFENANQKNQTRYSKMTIEDKVDQLGIKFEGIKKISVVDRQGVATEITDDLIKSTEYATYTQYNHEAPYENGNAGFKLEMKLNTGEEGTSDYDQSKKTADFLAKYAGQDLIIEYAVSFTDKTPIDVQIGNEVKVVIGQKGTDDTKKDDAPEIGTGGKKFLKYEKIGTSGSSDVEKPLAGAKFVILNSAKTHYLVENSNGKYEWVPIAANFPNAKVLVSDDEGKFEITGLEFGDYYLRETYAPPGFQKLTDDVKFVISKGSYAGSAAEVQKVANVPEGFLPATGGMGILIFLIIGSVLMIGAVIKYRRVQSDSI